MREQGYGLLLPKTVLLSDEETNWIKEHPVIRTTSKHFAAPIEFIRAGEAAGFSVDYLNMAASNVGLTLEYVTDISWPESLRGLESREIDISHNIIEIEERTKFLTYTDPYFQLELVLFGRTDSAPIRSAEDLNDKKIALQKDLGISRDFRGKYPDLQFIEFNSSAEALLAISEERADLYMSPASIGHFNLTNNFISDVVVVSDADFLDIANTGNSRIAVRNDWPILFQILEKGMAAITIEQLEFLNEKWLVVPNFYRKLILTEEELRWLMENPIAKVAADPSLLPVEAVNENGKIIGMSGSYLDIISKKLDIKFEWIGNENFGDGLNKAASKEADIVSGASASGTRGKFLSFTESYMTLEPVIFGRVGDDIFGDMNGLSGRTIAMPRAFDITGMIKRDYPQINVIETTSKKDALNLVSTGVADAHIGSVPITSQNIAAENITNMVVAGVTPYKTEIAIGIRSELPFLVSSMSKAMASITPEVHAQIYSRWVALKIEPKTDYTLVVQISVGAAVILIVFFVWNAGLRQEVRRRKFSEERFRQIAETMDGVFFICSPNLKQVKYVSPNFESWTGKACDEIYNSSKTWIDIIHPEDRDLFHQSAEEAVKTGFKRKLPDYRIIDRDNNTRYISTQAHLMDDENGKVVSVIGFINDVSTRVQSKAKLSEISNQFQNAFNHASHGMALVSMDGNFIRVNDAICDIFGYSEEEFLRLNINEVNRPEDFASSRKLMDEVINGKRQSSEIEKSLICKDGSLVPIQLNVSLVRDAGGNPVHFVAQVQDLSALKEREDQLRHSQKMDAVGKLTGGIAHDFNNILGIILGNLEILKSTMPEEPASAKRLDKAIKGVDRGSHLIKKLLSFSRKIPGKSGAICVNDGILNLSDFIERSFATSINVKTVLADDLWPIEADGGDLEDAILNLALNARDAMPNGGDLLIETSNVTLDNVYAAQNPDSRSGDHVMISINDSGSGVAPELIDKILEPFFTTKPMNKGTGLGLSMVHGFVQRSEGHMRIHSDVEKGTTIKVYIPKSEREIETTTKKPIIETKLPKGSEIILVVDDEKNLCEVAKEQLTALGYSVYTANNTSSALDLLSKLQNVDLLFSDIVMPDNLDGYEMASAALRMQPKLKILLTTGYSQNREENINGDDETLSSIAHNMLQKPYNQSELALAVRMSLDV